MSHPCLGEIKHRRLGLRSSVLSVRRTLRLSPEGSQRDWNVPSSTQRPEMQGDLTWSSGFSCCQMSGTPPRPLD